MNNNTNYISTELKEYFRSLNLTQAEVAQRLHTSQAYVSSFINGVRAFRLDSAKRWEDALGISSHWLLTGEGDMLVDGAAKSEKQKGSADIVGAELRKYFHRNALKQVDVAKMLDVTLSYVNALLNGHKKFNAITASKWEATFGISAHWLMTGKGEMLTHEIRPTAICVPAYEYTSSDRHGTNSDAAIDGLSSGLLAEDRCIMLKRHFKDVNLTQIDIAQKLKSTQSCVNMLLNGRRPFNFASAKKWESAFGISARWLMTGEGEMMVPEDSGAVVASEPVGKYGVVAIAEAPHDNDDDAEVAALEAQADMLTKQNELLLRNIERITRQLESLGSDKKAGTAKYHC